MADEPKKMEIPRKLQIEMLKYFLQTSVPRKKKLDENKSGSKPLSEESDRGDIK